MSYRTIANNLDNLLIKSGVRNVTHVTEGGPAHGTERKSVARSNGFRKFVITNMIRAKVDFVSRPGMDELLLEYLKVLDLVTLDEENRLKIAVEELTENRIDNDYIINGKLDEKDRQIAELTKKQERFENLIQSLIDSGQFRPGK